RERGRSSFAFHPAGEVHSNRWLGPQPRCFHIEVAPALVERVRQYGPALDHPAHFPGGTPGWLAARLYDEFQSMDEVSPLAIEGLPLDLLAESARRASALAERRPPRWLLRVRDLLHASFAQPWTLAAIAGSVGVHPAHLARVFRRQHGCTVGAY